MERSILRDYTSAICNTPVDAKTFKGFVIGTAVAAKVKSDLTTFFVDVLHRTEKEAEDFYEAHYLVSEDIDQWAVQMQMEKYVSDQFLEEPDIRRLGLQPYCTIPTTVGGSDGVLDLVFRDGEKPIKYCMKLEGAPAYGEWQDTGVWEGISKGTYIIQAQDANGYVVQYTYIMNDPYVLTLEKTDCTTYGGADGTITASADGRTAPYTYSLDGITYQATGLFENLEAGAYTVYAKDAEGIVTFGLIEVGQPEV